MNVRLVYLALGVLSSVMVAQTTPNGTAMAKGTCSVAHQGNGDTIIIKDCGIGEEQGRRIIEMLDKLAKSNDISAKLDQLLAIVGKPIQFLGLTLVNVASPPGSHPRAGVNFCIDSPNNNGHFEVECDRACTPVATCTLQGTNTTKFATVSGRPNLAEFLFLRQFPPLTQCGFAVESRDDKPVKILQVYPSTRLEGLIFNAVQPNVVTLSGGSAIK